MKKLTFNQLIESNNSYLLPFAIHLTNNIDDAKDLVQETLYKAIIYKDKFQEGSNVKAWLCTIMRNTFINNYRKLQKFKSINADVSPDFLLMKQNKFAVNNGISNLNTMAIKSMVNNLPKSLKTPFELFYLGYKYHEIAEILNEPLGTIKSRIHFARKTLMEHIEYV
jgi:RNA polymerase sigma factor (sigma-70 family)